MAGPSFPNGQEGKEAPLTAQSRTRGAYRLPFIDNTQSNDTITASQWQEAPARLTPLRGSLTMGPNARTEGGRFDGQEPAALFGLVRRGALF